MGQNVDLEIEAKRLEGIYFKMTQQNQALNRELNNFQDIQKQVQIRLTTGEDNHTEPELVTV